MHVVLLTQYYPPETGAPQNRLSSLAIRLQRLGHEVTVLTAMPHYPVGRVYPGYRWKLFAKEVRDGVPVYRAWVFATPSKSVPLRLLNFLSFAVSCLVAGVFCLRRVDALIVETPPLFTAISGWMLARLKRAKFVVNVADLWVKAARHMGVVRNRGLIGAAAAVEARLYRGADLVTVQTRGIADDVRLTAPGARVYLLTNGVDPLRFSPDFGQPELLDTFGLRGKFIVGYAGIHGIVQRLDRVIEAGHLLRECPDVVLAFFGDGPTKPELEARAHAAGLDNVRFFPLQPAGEMPKIIPSWGAALVPLPDSFVGATALPSKMFEAMAAGVPLLLTAPEGEASEMIRAAKCGLCVAAENPQAVADGIKALYADRRTATELGMNGRVHVLEHFNRDTIARAFSLELESLAAAATPAAALEGERS